MLARKYGRVLAWSRRERLLNLSAVVRVLAARLDQILTAQIVKASSIKFVSVNDIYVVLWELEQLVAQVEDTLMIDVAGSRQFVAQLLQDSISMGSTLDTPLISAKYGLFKDWISTQRNFLISWLCYTKLPTHAADFWIERVDSSALAENTETDTSTTSVSTQGEVLAEGHHNSAWNEFVWIRERLPVLLISESLAQKIKFVGEAVKILDLAGKKSRKHEAWLQHVVSSIFLPSEGANQVGYKTFFGHWNALEAITKVNAMEKWAASSLHSLFIVEHRLLSHLQVLRDFFFLQDGFFYRTMFTLADTLMALTPGINAEHDMNVFFQESAASKQFLGEDSKSKLFQNLKLTFDPSYSRNTGAEKPPKIWANLSLDYTVTWPINLILSPSTLQQYNEIFQLLFQVKRLQIGLQSGWNLMRPKGLPPRLAHRFQMTRSQMGFFIDTLSQYLHVDVFSTQMASLDEKLAECQDFEDLLASHSRFLAQVRLQCFLSVPAFRRTFALLFDTIALFNGLLREFVQHSSTDSSSRSKPSKSTSGDPKSELSFTNELETLMKDWAKHTSLLFTLLSGVKGQAPHLHCLLLLLDYNLFFCNGKSITQLEAENPLESAVDDNDRPVRAPRMAHVRSQSSLTTNLKSQEDPETKLDSQFSKAFASSSKPAADKPVPAQRVTTHRKAATSVEEEPAPKSSGPRPELLARLMRKTNKKADQ